MCKATPRPESAVLPVFKDEETLRAGGKEPALVFTKIVESNKFETKEAETLEACFLPHISGLCFPSMLDISKQSNALAKNVIVRRVQPVDNQRFAESVAILRKGESVAWIGHSDIGKSTEFNFLLMEFLTHLGKEGWPKFVTHRIRRYLYEYSIGVDGSINCYNSRDAIDLENVEKYCWEMSQKPLPERPLLFLDLEERENDPRLFGIQIFSALTSEYVEAQLKTLIIGGDCSFFVVRPHTAAELRMMGRLMLCDDREGTMRVLGLTDDKAITNEVVDAEIEARVKKIGPLPRWVFMKEREPCCIYKHELTPDHSI